MLLLLLVDTEILTQDPFKMLKIVFRQNLMTEVSCGSKVNAADLHFESSFQGFPTCPILQLCVTCATLGLATTDLLEFFVPPSLYLSSLVVIVNCLA